MCQLKCKQEHRKHVEQVRRPCLSNEAYPPIEYVFNIFFFFIPKKSRFLLPRTEFISSIVKPYREDIILWLFYLLFGWQHLDDTETIRIYIYIFITICDIPQRVLCPLTVSFLLVFSTVEKYYKTPSTVVLSSQAVTQLVGTTKLYGSA